MSRLYRHAGLSDIGKVRTKNEDRWRCDASIGLYIVSDGVGGHFAGDIASQAVVETLPLLIRNRWSEINSASDSVAAEMICQVIAQLSNMLYRRARGKPGLDSMGATVVLAIMRNHGAIIAHLGDSRAYVASHDGLEQLTSDHSMVQLLVDQQEIRPEESVGHPSRHQITRYVGMASEPLPEARVVMLRPGDQLLLCSDGLTNMLGDNQILALLQSAASPETACRGLIDAANDAGGKDNVTVVVVDV